MRNELPDGSLSEIEQGCALSCKEKHGRGWKERLYLYVYMRSVIKYLRMYGFGVRV